MTTRKRNIRGFLVEWEVQREYVEESSPEQVDALELD